MGANGIYGLSGSGLDIESLVKVGMISKQNQLNKMQQTETTNTWLKEEWSTIYDKYKDYQNTLSTFKLQSNMNAMKASSGNPNVVTATANGAAAAMTHNVQVSQVATNAYMMTDNGKTVERASTDITKKTSPYLRDILYKDFTKTGKTTVEGKEVNTYKVTNPDGTTKDVKGSDTALSISFNDGENSGTIKYTYEEIFGGDKSLNDFASAIASSGVSLQGNYDSVNDTFAIYAKNSGSKSIIGISANDDTGADLLNRMNLAAYDGNTETLTAIGDFSVGASDMSTTGMTSESLNDYDTLGFKVKEMSAADIAAYNQYIDDNRLSTEKLKTDGSKTYYMTYTAEISTPYNGLTQTDLDALGTEGVTSEEMTEAEIDDYNANLTDPSQALAKDGTKYYKATVNSPDISTATVVDANAEALAFDVSDGDKTTINVKYSYKEIADGTATMSDIASKISAGIAAAGSDTTMTSSYDNVTHKLTLGNTSGAVNVKARDEVSATLLNKAGFEDSSGVKKTFTSGSSAGTTGYSLSGVDAKVKIDGRDYTLDSNKKTIAGVTYNFTGVTNGASTTVSVTQDTEKIVEHVSNFVNAYNEMLDYLNEKLEEPKYSDFKPLTQTQQDQMTEEQVKKWNEKAKSGLLYHNDQLRTMVSQMREAIYTPVNNVDSKYNSASAIGISSSTIKGHITLDVDKLQKALADDPDCVYQIFASDQDSSYILGSTNKNKLTNSQKKLDYQGSGIATRLYNTMGDFKSKVEELAGTSKETNDQSYLGKLITNLQTRMSTFKTQMNAFENALYKKYDSMEMALARLGAQMNYISGN